MLFLKFLCLLWLFSLISLWGQLWFCFFEKPILLLRRIWKAFLRFLWIWFYFEPFLLSGSVLLLCLCYFGFRQFFHGLWDIVRRESRFRLYTLLRVLFLFIWSEHKNLWWYLVCKVWPYPFIWFGRDNYFCYFSNVAKKLQFFISRLCLLKHWCLISSKKGLFCSSLCFLTKNISCDGLIYYEVLCQSGY